jgi:hypothetical protein
MRTNFITHTHYDEAISISAAIEAGRKHDAKLHRGYKRGGAICLLCGEYLGTILPMHARQHGYSTVEEFKASGNVRLL